MLTDLYMWSLLAEDLLQSFGRQLVLRGQMVAQTSLDRVAFVANLADEVPLAIAVRFRRMRRRVMFVERRDVSKPVTTDLTHHAARNHLKI